MDMCIWLFTSVTSTIYLFVAQLLLNVFLISMSSNVCLQITFISECILRLFTCVGSDVFLELTSVRYHNVDIYVVSHQDANVAAENASPSACACDHKDH